MLYQIILKSALCILCLSLIACGAAEQAANEADNIGGSASVAASHNAGMDCMSSSCHSSGNGIDVFTAAGTIYKSGGVQTNATVTFFVNSTNTVAAVMKTDASGNFYTTETIEELVTSHEKFSIGVNVQVKGPSGGIRDMSGALTSASCGLCHGDSKIRGRVVAN